MRIRLCIFGTASLINLVPFAHLRNLSDAPTWAGPGLFNFAVVYQANGEGKKNSFMFVDWI